MLNRLPEELTSDWGSGLKLVLRPLLSRVGGLCANFSVRSKISFRAALIPGSRTIDFWVG